MKYTIYNLESGQIISIRDCPDITQQILDPSYSYIEGEYSGTEYYIENSLPVEIPEKPSPYALFDFNTKEWVLNSNLAVADVSKRRKQLLVSSDWTQLPNGPLTQQQQEAWAVYRQQLRDIPEQSGYPFNVVWPTPP